MLVGAVGIIASIAGTYFVKLGKKKNIMHALYKGLGAAGVISTVLFYFVTNTLMGGNGLFDTASLFYASLVGVVVTVGMVAITEFFTSKQYGAVKHIAEASNTGHGTNIIAGLGISMKSTLPPVLLIAFATLIAYSLAGLYGVAVAAMSMISLTGIVVAIDAFGPITDNAGGIAEMTNQPPICVSM